MAYVIAEPCIDVKDTACVDTCWSLHSSRKNESDSRRDATVYRSG